MQGSLRLAPINIIIISLAYNTRSLLLPTILETPTLSFLPCPPFVGPPAHYHIPISDISALRMPQKLMLTIGFSQSTSLLLASGPGLGPATAPPPSNTHQSTSHEHSSSHFTRWLSLWPHNPLYIPSSTNKPLHPSVFTHPFSLTVAANN